MIGLNVYPHGRVGHNDGDDCPCLPEAELLDAVPGTSPPGEVLVLIHGDLEPVE